MINLFDSNPVNGHSFMNDLKKEFDKREMKQTAVEWYEIEINSLFEKYEAKQISRADFLIMKHNIFYPAKQMEKEQMKDAFTDLNYYTPFDSNIAFDEYYKEKYE